MGYYHDCLQEKKHIWVNLLKDFLYRGGLFSLPWFVPTSRTLFIIAHGRSGSTLLGHVLNTNPDMRGYVETHLSYKKPRDIRWLWSFVRQTADPKFDPSRMIAVDKIVSTHVKVDPHFMRSQNVMSIFLIREPVGTITNHLNTFARSLESAEFFYVKRLSQMRELALSLADPSKACCVRYDDLVHRTDEALKNLTSFLGLQEPLRSSYSVGEYTGKAWYGDPSTDILAGEIREMKETTRDIPSDVLRRCQEAYDETWQVLSAHCTVI